MADEETRIFFIVWYLSVSFLFELLTHSPISYNYIDSINKFFFFYLLLSIIFKVWLV